MMQKILNTNNYIRLGLLFVLLLTIKEVKGQNCPEITGDFMVGMNAIGLEYCAPVEFMLKADVQLRYKGCTPGIITFEIDWGDLTTQTVSPTTVKDNGSNGGADFWIYTLSVNHKYERGFDMCKFPVAVTLKENGKKIYTQTTNAERYHQVDDYWGARNLVMVDEKTGHNVFLVCEGQEVRIKFQDRSELNCNFPDPDNEKRPINYETRYLQFEYGTTGSNIPDVFVAGSQITGAAGSVLSTRIDGGDTYAPNTVWKSSEPAPRVTGRLTNEIFIAAGTTVGHVGKEFYVTLYNWNKCNELANKTNPTAADRAYARTTTALIRVVAQPPKPDDVSNTYCNRIGNNYPDAHYAVTVPHAAGVMKPGYYLWYRDDGSGGPDMPGHPDLNNLLFRTESTSPNCLLFNPVTKFPVASQDYLNPTIAQKKFYWVVYYFENPAVGPNPYPKLCGSDPALIEYTIREDISPAPPAQPALSGCSGEIFKIYANGGAPAPVYPIGDATRYVWTGLSGFTKTGQAADGHWIEVQATTSPPPAAPSFATATVNVHLEWTSTPNCPSALRQLSAQINPKPTASLDNGGTICPDEDIELTVKGIKGLGSNKAFTIEITGEAPVTVTLPSVGDNYKITVHPANNTVTDYSFVKLTDLGTGCSSVPASTQRVIKRAVLHTSTFGIDGANEVCEHTSATYSVNPPGGNPATVNIGVLPLQVSEATRYLWHFNGIAGTPASVSNKVLSAAEIGAAPATKNLEVIWQYANIANRSNKANKYCPSLPVAKTIRVVPKPTVKINDNSLTRTVCNGSGTTIDVDLTGIPNKDWVIQWSISGWVTETIPGTASGKSTYPVTIPNTTIPNPGGYTFTLRSVSQFADGGCAGTVLDPKEAKIKVIKTPAAGIPIQSKQYCSGTTVEIPLTLTGENTGTYQVQYQIVSVAHGTVMRTVNIDWDKTPYKLTIGVNETDQNDGAATTVTILSVTEHTLGLDNMPVSCSGTVSGDYTIITLANLPGIDAGPDYDVCDPPGPYNLNISGLVTIPPAGYNAEWFVVSRPPAGGSFNPASKDIPGTIYTPGSAGIHILEWVIQSTVPNVCPALRDTVILSWGVTTSQPSITPVPPVCYDVNQPLLYAPQLNGSAPKPNQEMGEWTKVSGPGIVSFTDKTDNNTKITVTAYGTYVLRWTIKSGSCPPKQADVTVVFNEVPVQTPVPVQEYCPATLTTMPAFGAIPAVPAHDFTWKFTGVTMPGFSPNGSGNFPNDQAPANNTTLNKNYQLEVTAKIAVTGCISKQLVDIRLKPQPQMVIIRDTEVCEGSEIEFKLATNLNSDVIYNWNNDQAIGLPLNGPTTPIQSPYIHKFTTINPSPAIARTSVTAHITNLVAEVNSCKSTPQNFDLTVDPKPVLTMPLVAFCPGDTVGSAATKVISNVASSTFQWHYSGQPVGLTNFSGNTDNVGKFEALENTSNFSFIGMVTVQVTAGECMVQDSYELELKPRLNVNPVASQTVCSTPPPIGAFVVPFGASNSGIGVVGYTWKGVNHFGNAVTGNDPTQATISWLADNQSGADHVWQMEVTAESGNGCFSKPVPFKLTLHPRPKMQVKPQTICSGKQFAEMNVIGNDAGNTVQFDWKNDNINTGIPASGTQIRPNPWPIYPIAVNTSSAPVVSTIKVVGTSRNRCVGDTATFTMTINPAPDLNPLNPLPICPGIVVPQHNFGTSNIPANDPLLTYTWNISNTSVGIGLPATVSDTVAMRSFTAGDNNTANNKTAVVTVTATYDKCPSAPKSFTITLKPKPLVLPVNDINVCPNSAVQLPGFRTDIYPFNDTGISWKLDNGNIGNPVITPVSGNGSAPGFTAANNTSGTDLKGIYTVTAIINGCKSEELKFEVKVQSTPDVTWAVAPPAGQPPFYFCDNELVTIPRFASSAANATFKWTTNNKLIGASLNDNGSGPQIPDFISVNNTTGKLSQDIANFSVTASTSANCPSTPMLFDVIIRPVPRLDASANISVCAGTTVPSAPFVVTPAPGVGDVTSFSWEITNYATAIAAHKLNGLAPSGIGNLPTFTSDTLRTADPGSSWPWQWQPFWGDSVRRYHVDVDVQLNGCQANGVQKLYIDIKPLPVTTMAAENDDCVKDGDLKTFSADVSESGTPGSDYIWGVAQYAPPTGAAYAPAVLSPADLSFAKVYQYPNPMNDYWKGYITVKEQNRYGCSAPEIRLLTEAIPAPVVNAGPDIMVCSGTPIKLRGSVIRRSGSAIPIIADWRPPVYVKIDGDEQTFEPTVVLETTSLTPVITKMWVVAHEGKCVSKPDTVEITVNPTPLQPTLSHKSYCSSVTQMDMTVLNAGSNDIHWYRVAAPDIPILTANNMATVNMNDKLVHPNALPPALNYIGNRKEALINYKVILENAYHCISTPKEVTLTVMKIADRPTPGGPFEYCKNTNTVFDVTASGMDGNFKWYNDTIPMIHQAGGDTYSVQVMAAGSYEYYVTQTGVNGCESYPIAVPLEILPNPALSFTFTDAPGGNAVTYGCADWLVYATNTSTNPAGTAYNWRWDDGKPSDSAPEGIAVAHTYGNSGPFAVDVKPMLTGVSAKGCQSSLVQPLEILPYIKANFTPSPNEGCSPLAVTFLSPTTADRFNWYLNRSVAPTAADTPDFTGKNDVNQTFVNTTGLTETYHVWLYAENGSGAKKCSSVKDTFVIVHPQPNVAFTHDAFSAVCSPKRVVFTNTSANNPASTVYTLRYGDQLSDLLAAGDTISHLYKTTNTSPTPIHPKLTAANIIGVYTCESETQQTLTINPPIKADFTGPTDGCSPFLGQFVSQSYGASNFTWSFTGAGNVTEHTSLHVHTPKVTLTNAGHTTVEHVTVQLAVSNDFCSDNISKTFLLNPQPAVSFVMDKIMGCQPLDVTFTNTSTGNPVSGMTYTFEFGDASNEITTIPSSITNTYTNLLSQNDEVYPKLTSKNQWNCTNSISGLITIYPYIVADFRMSDSVACPPLTINFTNGSKGNNSLDWRVNGATWASWTQSGSSTTGLNPSYTFTNSNMLNDDHYQVELVASNGQCTDTKIRNVLIYRKPIPDFTASPMVQFYPGSTVTVANKISTNPTVINSFQYNWQLSEQGSGISNTFSTLPDPGAETIGKWGAFDITQAVYAEHCSDQKTLTVSIIAPVPLSGFDSIAPACMPYEVQFNNTSKNANTYFWDFGDGFTSNVEHPIHLYPDPGTYTVTLTIKGDGGTTSSRHKVVVHPMPRANFEVKPDFLWVGQELRAFSLTSNTTSSGQEYDIWYRWDWGDNTETDSARQPLHMYRKAGDYDITLTIGTYTTPQCIHTHTIENAVNLENAGDIILPNSFKPWETGQTDGVIHEKGYQNNLFYPPVLSPTRKYSFVVYNRWGQLLFETTDPGIGWDGYFKGKLCDEGVYVYKIEGVFETGQSFSKMGDILLLR